MHSLPWFLLLFTFEIQLHFIFFPYADLISSMSSMSASTRDIQLPLEVISTHCLKIASHFLPKIFLISIVGQKISNQHLKLTLPQRLLFHVLISSLMLHQMGLPQLEELALDINQNVRDAGPELELLNSKCPRLKSWTLGRFYRICRAVHSKLDGFAPCRGLVVSIKNCADLTDSSLTAISLGCIRLVKFEIQGCKRITEIGIRTMAHALWQTLVEVKISSCKYLNAVCPLRALKPIQDCMQRLHINCEWRNSSQQSEGEGSSSHRPSKSMNGPTGKRFTNWGGGKLLKEI
ncbi:hypothetical protein RJ641_018439 [Dillenia turbinata]|uniref:Uncharacterized protein n=1 Tax=Dillenia turbinata TaxID=194707 RepID=A0AAN8Z1X4_9MAGN